MSEGQARYRGSEKGAWTQKMIPSVIVRCRLPLQLDHYVTQFLTGHADFRAKLLGFRLSNSPLCQCGIGEETAEHVLDTGSRTTTERHALKQVLHEEGLPWPPDDGAFLASRRTYEAFKAFSNKVLTERTDR